MSQKLKDFGVVNVEMLTQWFGGTSGCCSSIPGLQDKGSGQPLSLNLPFYRDIREQNNPTESTAGS